MNCWSWRSYSIKVGAAQVDIVGEACNFEATWRWDTQGDWRWAFGEWNWESWQFQGQSLCDSALSTMPLVAPAVFMLAPGNHAAWLPRCQPGEPSWLPGEIIKWTPFWDHNLAIHKNSELSACRQIQLLTFTVTTCSVKGCVWSDVDINELLWGHLHVVEVLRQQTTVNLLTYRAPHQCAISDLIQQCEDPLLSVWCHGVQSTKSEISGILCRLL